MAHPALLTAQTINPYDPAVQPARREKRRDQVVFVYEYLTGGELLTGLEAPDSAESLLAEGRAMRAALAEDFAKAGAEVLYLRASRQQARQYDDSFDRTAAMANWTVVIAPEIGGALKNLSRRVGAVGGRLLGGPMPVIELAGDKHATAVHLAPAGVPVPHGIRWTLGQPWPGGFPYPAVWKPLDGAGSQGVRFVPHDAAPMAFGRPSPGRLEQFCPGIAASVGFLCGPQEIIGLPPCRQRLSDDGRFSYLGGSFDLSPALAERAALLAQRAVASLPAPLGYIGVDLVLGDRGDGRGDVVIEINPRLTTSYVGLRAACRQNLAAAMLAIASGETYPMSFVTDSIEFSSAGRVGIAHHRP